MVECELCDLVIKRNIITRKYYEDDNFIMVDCKLCLVPMLVFKRHTLEVDETDKDMAYNLFFRYAQRIKPADWYVDCNMRNIKTHWHVHLRRKE